MFIVIMIFEILNYEISDNAATGTSLFNAFDSAGHIDLLISVGYSFLASNGPAFLGQLKRFSVDANHDKCTGQYRYSPRWFEGNVTSADFEKVIDVIEELPLFTLNPEMTKKVAIATGKFNFLSYFQEF